MSYPDQRILIVDGDQDAVRFLKRLMRPLGHIQSTWVSSLEQGMALLDEHDFAAVITDLGPGGLDHLVALRRAAPLVPLVVLTRSGDTIASQAIQLGAQESISHAELTTARLSQALRCAIVRKSAELELQRHAHYDQLTGLLNKHRFTRILDQRVAEQPEQPLTLLFLDLNDFKAINDTHGHRAGDVVLSVVGRRLLAATRACDAVARLSGDEFAVLMEGDPSAAAAERIRAAIMAPISHGAHHLVVGVSVGHASFPAQGRTAAALLEQADAAMYGDKRRQKGRTARATSA